MLKTILSATNLKVINLSKSFAINAITKTKMPQVKSLQKVISALEKFAPLNAAESWDNVGLLVEPFCQREVRNILLTNDLTVSVMDEAEEHNIDMIISYHPPIFSPLKRITQSHWKERIVSQCLSSGIAVYSPHTAWDTVKGGVNDWLASAFPVIDIEPIIKPNVLLPEGSGAGRKFTTNLQLHEACEKIKSHIGGLNVQVAVATDLKLEQPITTVAVCAGSGSSVLKGVKANLFVTGEMSHHEVLEANHQNTSVILCNHSNSERGFLSVFKTKLENMLDGNYNIIVSKSDCDPLKLYEKIN